MRALGRHASPRLPAPQTLLRRCCRALRGLTHPVPAGAAWDPRECWSPTKSSLSHGAFY